MKKCNYKGCNNKAYREVYPKVSENERTYWCYLCRRHFEEEKKNLRMWCSP